MSTTRRSVLFGAMATSMVVALPALSQTVSPVGAARKINVAGRQRMLSQRIAMATSLARLGVDVEGNVGTALAATEAFESAQIGLRNGSENHGLIAETHPSVISSLNKVDLIWGEMKEAVQSINQRGKVARADFNVISEVNLRLLSRANIVVKKLVSAYSENDRDDLGIAQAIDMAGRQRMLSQKMIKEAAMIGLSSKKRENREFLAESAELFDTSLFALMWGDENQNIPAPPEAVKERFKIVEALWLDLYPLLDEIASLGRAGKFELEELSFSANELLTLSNDAVVSYVETWDA